MPFIAPEIITQAKQALLDAVSDWWQMMKKQKSGQITKAEYDEWRYNYPDGIRF